jgi:DNA-binding NarL/FixJ family response regulator
MTSFSQMRFLIADDHPLYRDAVRAQIERLFAQASVDEVNSIDELYDVASPEASGADYNLMLLDLFMPGMSPGAVREVSARFPNVPIAVISGTASPAMIRQCVEAGARGFIPKTASGEHMAHAIQILLNGGTTIPAHVLLAGEPETGDGAATPPDEAWLQSLNAREFAVLRGVVRGQSNKQIAREMGIAEVTVKFHLRVLFRKLGVNRRAQVAVAASKAGVA